MDIRGVKSFHVFSSFSSSSACGSTLQKASPLTHLALNVAPKNYGETPNVTLSLETKFKDGSAETAAYRFSDPNDVKKAGKAVENS